MLSVGRLHPCKYYTNRSKHLLSECYQATRIAYGGSKEFKRVVTLDGALFEKSGTMSGGGRKPRGGKMGTSIRASVSSEGVAQAERELAQIVDELSSLRHKISDAVRCYQAAEKAVYHLEMEVAKCQKEVCFYLVLNFKFFFLRALYSSFDTSFLLMLLTDRQFKCSIFLYREST